MSEISIRPLSGLDELSAGVEIQKETWGAHFDDIVSAALMQVAQKIGGIAAGAFSADELVGMIFGLSGFRDRRPVHWSHMLAVRPSQQGQGLGALLKFYQASQVRRLGIHMMYWTFDPLEAKNAHFNLNRLHARIDDHFIDMYGPGDSSPLHHGIGTDRFVVEWDLESVALRRLIERLEDSLKWDEGRSEAGASLPFRIERARSGVMRDEDLPEPGMSLSFTADSRAFVEIPANVQNLKSSSPEEARDWRTYTRAAFNHYLSKNYRVTSFLRHLHTGRYFYVLEVSN